METTIRKIGNAVGVLIPHELHAQVGDTYWISKINDVLVMPPVRNDLFANEEDWIGFRESLSQEDDEWDKVDDKN